MGKAIYDMIGDQFLARNWAPTTPAAQQGGAGAGFMVPPITGMGEGKGPKGVSYGQAGKVPGGNAGTSPVEPEMGVQTTIDTPIPTPSPITPAGFPNAGALFSNAQARMANMGSAAPASFDYSSIMKAAPDLLKWGQY